MNKQGYYGGFGGKYIPEILVTTIAELIKECIIDQKNVREEVNRFRLAYQDVKYSFDDIEDGPDSIEAEKG